MRARRCKIRPPPPNRPLLLPSAVANVLSWDELSPQQLATITSQATLNYGGAVNLNTVPAALLPTWVPNCPQACDAVLARRAATGATLAVTLLPVLRVAMAAAVAWSAVYRFFTLFATQPWLQGLNPSLYFNVARLVQFWM